MYALRLIGLIPYSEAIERQLFNLHPRFRRPTANRINCKIPWPMGHRAIELAIFYQKMIK